MVSQKHAPEPKLPNTKKSFGTPDTPKGLVETSPVEDKTLSQKLSTPLSSLGFVAIISKSKLLAILSKNNIDTLGDLIRLSREDILRMHGIGAKKLKVIEWELEGHGLSLKCDESESTSPKPIFAPQDERTREVLARPVKSFKFSKLAQGQRSRLFTALASSNIHSIADLVEIDESELGSRGNRIGSRSINVIKEELEALGLSLGMGRCVGIDRHLDEEILNTLAMPILALDGISASKRSKLRKMGFEYVYQIVQVDKMEFRRMRGISDDLYGHLAYMITHSLGIFWDAEINIRVLRAVKKKIAERKGSLPSAECIHKDFKGTLEKAREDLAKLEKMVEPGLLVSIQKVLDSADPKTN